jgi:hypothetical protein
MVGATAFAYAIVSFGGMSDRMDKATRKERVHIALGSGEAEILNEFRLAALLATRSDALHRLIRISLSGNMPDDHVQIIRKIKKLRERLTEAISEPKTQHVQITLDRDEIAEICRYQHVAGFKSKSVTIRYLLHAALGDRFPPEHPIRLNEMRNVTFPAP